MLIEVAWNDLAGGVERLVIGSLMDCRTGEDVDEKKWEEVEAE